MKKVFYVIPFLSIFALFVVTGVKAQTNLKDLVVDDDKVECSNADYATIEEAYQNALPGQKIIVCDGTYKGIQVEKEVHFKARGKFVVINDGPNTHPFLRAGFLFPGNGKGSKSSIEGFTFDGEVQTTKVDDGKLDFMVFSRGADAVRIYQNKMDVALQGITNWHGRGWSIEMNQFSDLYTLDGGGIGILIGTFDGNQYGKNRVYNNKIVGKIKVSPEDGGGYNGTGIVLYSDYRWGSSGGELVGNTIERNRVKLVSDNPGVVDAVAFEATDSRDDEDAAGYPVIYENIINGNVFNGSSIEYDFTPDDLANHNTYTNNQY